MVLLIRFYKKGECFLVSRIGRELLSFLLGKAYYDLIQTNKKLYNIVKELLYDD